MNATRSSRSSLHRQLVVFALAGVVLPIAISGSIAFFILSYQLDIIATGFARSRDVLTDDIAGTDLRAQAINATRQLDEFLVERIAEARAWAAADVVVEAARDGASVHATAGLAGVSIAELENRFRVRKSLNAFPEASRYLRQQIASSPHFAEVFFTDRNGFNVALTNPTSDFVQSDEDWWQSAWSQGVSVGEIEYDESAGVWSLDISIRIDEPGAEEPVGLMKTVLSIESVQRLADRTAESIPGGRVEIATGRGVLIAETSSGHARERIMNQGVNISEQGDPSVRSAFSAERSGFARDERWISGYARTGGRDVFSASTRHFAGLDWVVVLQRPVADIQERLSVLREIENALRSWPGLLGISFGAVALVSIVLALFLAAAAARRISDALGAICEMAERASRGESVTVPSLSRPHEIVRLNEAVHGLCRVLMTVLRERQARTA